MIDALLVALGAAVGAPLRHLVTAAVQRGGRRFPLGTLVVNVVGCLVLGAVTGAVSAGAGDRWGLLLGTGLCGALTTYSTFSYETLRLVETGGRRTAAVNAVVSVVAGTAALVLGLTCARLLAG